jgi:hypothetical protein
MSDLRSWLNNVCTTGVINRIDTSNHSFIVDKTQSLMTGWLFNDYDYSRGVFVNKRVLEEPHLPSRVLLMKHLRERHPIFFEGLNLHETASSEFGSRIDQCLDCDTLDVGLHWFHEHFGEIWRKLDLRGVSDPFIEIIKGIWKSAPFMYSHFVPLNVQYSFEKNNIFLQKHRHNYDGTEFELRVLSPSQSIHPKFVESILFRMTLMSLLGAHSCDKKIVVTWFPSSRKKTSLRVRGQTWTPFQLNTGCTYRNSCNTVTIWRKEECLKTVLHELMHAFGWENIGSHDDNILKSFNISERSREFLCLYEGYVETWVSLLNAYIISSSQLPLDEILFLETRFVVLQIAKIIFYSGFETWESFYIGIGERERP